MKVFLLIPDGIGVKNFVFGGLSELLRSRGDKLVICISDSIQKVFDENGYADGIERIVFPGYRESLLERFVRVARTVAHMRRVGVAARTTSFAVRGRPGFLRALHDRLAYFIGTLLGSTPGLKIIDAIHRRASESNPANKTIENVLREVEPDVVFCTHQRAVEAVPFINAAKKLEIPGGTFIFSWDNIPKNRMPLHPDFVFVWSEFMKDELLNFHPELSEDQVCVVGTPQFEFHFTSEPESREGFLTKLGLDPARPVICYTGGDLRTSPFDQDYLRDLAMAVRDIDLARRPQIILRNSPADSSDRYAGMLSEFPEIVFCRAEWLVPEAGGWKDAIPEKEDIAFFSNLARHFDLVVSVGSTTALDFAVFDKPAIYLAYEPGTDSTSRWSAADIFKLPHFELVHALQPVHWVKGRGDLKDTIVSVLDNPKALKSERAEWLSTIAVQPLADASVRIYKSLRGRSNHA